MAGCTLGGYTGGGSTLAGTGWGEGIGSSGGAGAAPPSSFAICTSALLVASP
jgi:hypothetical protein